MAILVIAWQYLPNETQQIKTTGANNPDREVARLRAALDNPEAAQRSLKEELDLARDELRSRQTIQPLGWHEDSNLLLYRSPRWKVRTRADLAAQLKLTFVEHRPSQEPSWPALQCPLWAMSGNSAI